MIYGNNIMRMIHLMMQILLFYFCLQSVVPAESLDSDIKSLYLKIKEASGHGVDNTDEVTWL